MYKTIKRKGIKIMTKKELYQAIVDGNITDDVKAKAAELLTNENKSSEGDEKKKAERKENNLAIAAIAATVMSTDKPMTATEIFNLVKGDEVKNLSQVTTALKYATAEGTVNTINNGKKVNTYTLVATEDETEG